MVLFFVALTKSKQQNGFYSLCPQINPHAQTCVDVGGREGVGGLEPRYNLIVKNLRRNALVDHVIG